MADLSSPAGWPAAHAGCRRHLIGELQHAARETRAEHPEWSHPVEPDIEVHVTEVPPLVASPWTASFTCPHGVTFHMEPTGVQFARWAAAGTP